MCGVVFSLVVGVNEAALEKQMQMLRRFIKVDTIYTQMYVNEQASNSRGIPLHVTASQW